MMLKRIDECLSPRCLGCLTRCIHHCSGWGAGIFWPSLRKLSWSCQLGWHRSHHWSFAPIHPGTEDTAGTPSISSSPLKLKLIWICELWCVKGTIIQMIFEKRFHTRGNSHKGWGLESELATGYLWCSSLRWLCWRRRSPGTPWSHLWHGCLLRLAASACWSMCQGADGWVAPARGCKCSPADPDTRQSQASLGCDPPFGIASTQTYPLQTKHILMESWKLVKLHPS